MSIGISGILIMVLKSGRVSWYWYGIGMVYASIPVHTHMPTQNMPALLIKYGTHRAYLSTGTPLAYPTLWHRCCRGRGADSLERIMIIRR